jgi:Protein of unknown function (DUF2946)
MDQAGIMARNGLRQGRRDLARIILGVLLVYALALQMLVPLAVARTEAQQGRASALCAAMVGPDGSHPAKMPARAASDCLACCLASGVAVVMPSTGLPELDRLTTAMAPAAPERHIPRLSAGGPPPQRAPPGNLA